MRKKIALNVLYNVCLMICLVLAYTFGFEHPRWDYFACAIILGGVLVILKIRLMKEVRDMQKP